MASVMRYRSGVVSYIALPTAAGYPIEVGDLVGYSGGKAYPASYFSTIAAFHSAFAGVAVQKIGLQPGETSFKLTTDPGWILVAVSGDFEFDCATGISWVPGSLVCGVALAYATDATSWVTGTAYAAGQVVYNPSGNLIYQVLVSNYTSGATVAADVTAGYLRQIYLKNQKVALAADYTTALGIIKLAYPMLGSTTSTSVIVSIKSTLQHSSIPSGI